jgi:hypothetical protein
MTHRILSMLPDEVRALHFEEEVDALSRQIEAEKVKGRISRQNERKTRVLPARSRSAMSAKEEAQAAHDALVKAYGTAYCHHEK